MYGLFSIHPFLCHGRDNFIKEEDWRKFIRKKRYDLMPFIIKYNINKFLFGLFYSFLGMCMDQFLSEIWNQTKLDWFAKVELSSC